MIECQMTPPISEPVTFIAVYRRDQAKKSYRSSEGRERGMWSEVHRDSFKKKARTGDGPLRVGGLCKDEEKGKMCPLALWFEPGFSILFLLILSLDYSVYSSERLCPLLSKTLLFLG